MIMRILMLVVLIAQMKLNSVDASDSDEEREPMGGEGFAKVVNVVVLLGAVLLGILIIVAILSMTGMFELDVVDPEV